MISVARPTRFTPEMIKEYTERGFWDMTTLSDVCEHNAKDYPHKEALVDSRVRLTWSQVNEYVDRLAMGFVALGLKKDAMVVTQLPNLAELFLWRVASERAGTLWLPALRSWRHREMESLLRFVKAEAIVIPRHFRDFDYFEMIKELHLRLPDLKYILVVGDEIPAGCVSVAEMLHKPVDKAHL